MRILQCGAPLYYYYHNKQTNKQTFLCLVIGVYFILICKLIRIRYKILNDKVHFSFKETSMNALSILYLSAVVQNKCEKDSMYGIVHTATGYKGIATDVLFNNIFSIMKKKWIKSFLFWSCKGKRKHKIFHSRIENCGKLQFLFPSKSFQPSFAWDWGKGRGEVLFLLLTQYFLPAPPPP